MIAAQRRKGRRLRSWWRHEQQSIAVALAEALHHSAGPSKKKVVERRERQEEAGSETYYAPQRPKTLPPGMRPAPPPEVAGPQVVAATGGHVAAGAPLLTVSSLRAADGVDDTAVKFLFRAELKKEEERKQELADEALDNKLDAEMDALMAIGPERLTSTECQSLRGYAGAGGADREEEEEEDDEEDQEEEEEASSLWLHSSSTSAVARSLCGFANCDAPRGVFPLVWPEMLGIVAGMDLQVGVFVVVMAVACAWLVLLLSLLALCFLLSSSDPSWPVWTRRTTTRLAPRAVFLCVVVRPKMLRIMAGTHQKDSYAVLPCHDAEAVFHRPDCSADP